MTIKPITAFGFRGMSNLPRAPARLLDDERRITPRIILNAIVTDGGVLEKRGGYTRKVALAGAHSLWAGSVMLCVADGLLYRLEGTQAMALATVSGPRASLSYAEIDNRVYLANLYWTGIYDLLTDMVIPWGLSLPPAPDITLVTGEMPPGTYTLCYTRTENGQLSGNGPLAQVSWERAAQGIQLHNLPVGGQCWITHPNGSKLFLAQLEGGVITGQNPQAQPLPGFTAAPPLGMSHFCQAFGRIWGCAGRKLVYSDPFQYEWFRAANFLPFPEKVVMVAPVSQGLFINSHKSTWFVEGSNPAKMNVRRIGDGAIPGTLTMAQMEGSHLEIARKVFRMPSPLWMSQLGVVVGTHTGHLVHLTEASLKVNPRSQGASYYQIEKGVPQVLISLHGLPVKQETDAELETIFKIGRLFVPEPLTLEGSVKTQISVGNG